MTPKVPHFTLGRALGTGSSAWVFEATNPQILGGAPVALKVARAGFEAYLVREARLLSRLATASRSDIIGQR